MKTLIAIFPLIFLLSCQDAALQQKVVELENALAEAKSQIQVEAPEPGLIHTVYVWLKEDISEEDRAAFVESMRSLETIESIRYFKMGGPAPTEDRPVVDNSFDYALITGFADKAGQDAYQIDPIHLAFVEANKDKWEKVEVKDNLVE